MYSPILDSTRLDIVVPGDRMGRVGWENASIASHRKVPADLEYVTYLFTLSPLYQETTGVIALSRVTDLCYHEKEFRITSI